MRRTTIIDVARQAGVSVATVSRALRGLPNVAPETREHVQAVAVSLDYEAHPQASRLASGRTMTVGLVAPLFGLWYASQVVAGAESVLAENGYDLLIHAVDTPEHRSRFMDRAGSLRGRVDGLMFVDFFATSEQADRLRSLNMPALTMGEQLEGFSSMTIDNMGAARVGVRYLLNLGHRRIGLMTGHPEHGYNTPVPDDRTRGYEDILSEAGIGRDHRIEVDGHFTVEGGAAAMAKLLDLEQPPTAIFCLSDEMAMGALGAARDRGWSVPDDISVLGFDGHDLAAAAGLSTMTQPVREMGRMSTCQLLDSITSPDQEPTRKTAPVALVVRHSTAATPKLTRRSDAPGVPGASWCIRMKESVTPRGDRTPGRRSASSPPQQ